MSRPRFRLYPPVWFVTCLALAWSLVRWTETPLPLPPGWGVWGGLLMGIGVTLSILTILAFQRSEASVLPFREPAELLDSGVFRVSRNPIYLGESLVLSGFALASSELLPWLAVPVFMTGIQLGVIRWEEATLRARFGPAYENYCRRTRRWL